MCWRRLAVRLDHRLVEESANAKGKSIVTTIQDRTAPDRLASPLTLLVLIVSHFFVRIVMRIWFGMQHGAA